MAAQRGAVAYPSRNSFHKFNVVTGHVGRGNFCSLIGVFVEAECAGDDPEHPGTSDAQYE